MTMALVHLLALDTALRPLHDARPLLSLIVMHIATIPLSLRHIPSLASLPLVHSVGTWVSCYIMYFLAHFLRDTLPGCHRTFNFYIPLYA